jgi:hypothetical protein
MPDGIKTFMVENAEIFYLNFSGIEKQYNSEGDRNFLCVLDEDAAVKMAQDGWAVKFPETSDEEPGKRPFIKIKVGYKIRPPKIVMITTTARTDLTEDTVGVLDWANIQHVDLIAQSYNWTYGSKTGVSAYLKTMFITVEEDELERKYALYDQEA